MSVITFFLHHLRKRLAGLRLGMIANSIIATGTITKIESAISAKIDIIKIFIITAFVLIYQMQRIYDPGKITSGMLVSREPTPLIICWIFENLTV